MSEGGVRVSADAPVGVGTLPVTGLAILDAELAYLFADEVWCRISGEPAKGLPGRAVGPRAHSVVGPAGLLAAVLADGHPRTHEAAGSRCTWQRLTIGGYGAGLAGLLVATTRPTGGEPGATGTSGRSGTFPSTVDEGHHSRIAETADRIGTTLDERTTCEELVGFLAVAGPDGHAPAAVAVDLITDDPREPGAPRVRRAAVTGDGELLPARPPAEVLRGEAGADGPRLALPLIHRGQVLGAVLVVHTQGAFTAHELLLARSAARRAAVAIDHSRLFGRSQRTAGELQRALLTDPGQPHPNLRVATRYLPSGAGTLVGGDWFEAVRLHFGRTLLVMGDVMGHGVEAAVDMNSYRRALRDAAAADLPPHRILRRLDQEIAGHAARRPAACLLAQMDPVRGLVSLSSAGHLPPVTLSASGTVELVDVPVGPPLGTGVGGYDRAQRPLGPDDTLLMFTDGLVERRGEDIDVSLARLARLRPDPRAPLDTLVDEILARLDAAHAEDDVAVLAARISFPV
ncbi:Putative magnesium or manganese-dependent protein phosphatase [Streptomyces clavuligerus]|uniref:Putative magnesium or manganese-dependent protein phosphatase n=1 Tax=Streptomyces clavuligerus TaxID=1901 RepID=E2PV00_STRCL|nr:Putative magnesium or manganese-dependent protein phosphatase [Streptomyces clavuligerus]